MYFRATDFLSLFLIGILIIQTKVQGSNADRPRAPAITPRPTTTTSSPTPSPCCSSSAIARTLAIYAGDRTGRAALRAATAADSLIYAMQECTRAYKLAHTAAMIIEQDVHNSNPHITTGSDMELTSEKCDEVTSAHNALLEKWREARRLVEEAEKQFEIAGGAADRGLHLIAHKVSVFEPFL